MTPTPGADRRLRPPRRLGPAGRRAFDVAVVAALMLLVVWSSYVARSVPGFVLSVAMVLPLLARRRHPGAVVVVVAALSLLQVLVLDQPVAGQVAVPVALYSLARYSGPVPAAAGLALGAVGAALAAWDWRARGFDDVDNVVRSALAIGLVALTAWALGALGRTRSSYVDALVDRGDRIERDAVQRVALAASDERARIAREMHDVVAHALSVVVVQADGARYAAAQDPRVATDALERIAGTGRSALADMRQLLGLLRSDETGTRPLPGLADVADLVEEAGATADLPGDAGEHDPHDPREPHEPEVSAAVGLTAYRVVQEALTNVRKHAGPGARAHVVVEVGRDDVVVAVRDDGRGAGADAPPDGPGHGLVGMRERVALHGGTVRHGPRPGGGYEVTVTLPRDPGL